MNMDNIRILGFTACITSVGETLDKINSIKKDRDYTIRLMEIVGTLES